MLEILTDEVLTDPIVASEGELRDVGMIPEFAPSMFSFLFFFFHICVFFANMLLASMHGITEMMSATTVLAEGCLVNQRVRAL